MMPPCPPQQLGSTTSRSPLAAMAMPTGATKLSPEETIVWLPSEGLTRMTPPAPPQQEWSTTRTSPGLKVTASLSSTAASAVTAKTRNPMSPRSCRSAAQVAWGVLMAVTRSRMPMERLHWFAAWVVRCRHLVRSIGVERIVADLTDPIGAARRSHPRAPPRGSARAARALRIAPGAGSAAAELRIEDVAEGVAEEVGAEDRRADEDAGRERHPRRGLEVAHPLEREHPAPGRCGRRHAETEEAQRGLY